MIQRIQPAYFFMLECFYLYFLVSIFYTRAGTIPPILPIIAILAGGSLLLYYAFRQKMIGNTIPFVGAVILSALAYFLGFSIMSVLLCVIFLYFRLGAFIKDSSLWREERSTFAIIFYSSSVAIFFIGWMMRYPHMNFFFGLVIVFTILFSIGRFLQQMGENNDVKDVSGLASVLGISALLTVILAFCVPFIKWAFYKIFAGIAIIAMMIGSPFFYLVEGIVLQLRPGAPAEDDEFEQVELPDKESTFDSVNPVDSIPPWVWIALIATVLLVAWLIVRKKSKIVDEKPVENTIHLQHTPVLSKMRKKNRLFADPTPQEYMRKLIHQLDAFAGKYHLGRQHHETIREWFSRVGFQENEALFNAYESVRYGNVNIGKNDASQFEVVIQNIKRDIKEKNKK
jgi:MFS family permease